MPSTAYDLKTEKNTSGIEFAETPSRRKIDDKDSNSIVNHPIVSHNDWRSDGLSI